MAEFQALLNEFLDLLMEIGSKIPDPNVAIVKFERLQRNLEPGSYPTWSQMIVVTNEKVANFLHDLYLRDDFVFNVEVHEDPDDDVSRMMIRIHTNIVRIANASELQLIPGDPLLVARFVQLLTDDLNLIRGGVPAHAFPLVEMGQVEQERVNGYGTMGMGGILFGAATIATAVAFFIRYVRSV